MSRREHHHRTRLAKLERALDVSRDEAAFEADRAGRMLVDNFK